MASVHSKIRTLVKPFLFKIMGKRFYKYAQVYGKMRDIKYRLVEEKELEIVPFLVNKNDVVLDIGANYAYYTERLSKLVGNAGKVYAFEPIPFTYQVCDIMVKKMNLQNVNLYNLGVADKTGTVVFEIPKVDFGAISAGQAHITGRANENISAYEFKDVEKVACKIVDLDTFLKDITRFDFMKIDIEGAEYFALNGMKNLLKKFNPIILIEICPEFLSGFGIAENALSVLFHELNYDVFMYNQTDKKLHIYQSKNFEESNYILIPKNKIEIYKNLIA